MSLLLVIILVLLLIGAIPRWGFNRSWGYAPFSIITTILVILLILWLLGML